MRFVHPLRAATRMRPLRPCAVRLIALAALAIAIAPPLAYAAPGVPLGAEDARHLLVRTGFGASGAEIARYAVLTREAAVDRLLAGTHTQPEVPPPAFAQVGGPLPGPQAGMQASAEDRRAFVRAQGEQTVTLRAWWISEMVATSSPLTERMTLFWHNHFVSSQQKVRVARLMYGQNALFRTYALGDFRALLHAAAKDPAMVLYLDSVQNRKGAPNENFAREVMELFTLGEGHYTEQDVKEAARAFTGWSLYRASGTFVFRPRLHDDGEKIILGKRGNFDGDAVLDLILARPETARFIVTKLWREFVSPDPDAAAVERVAQRFRTSGYDLEVALRGLLLEPAFWASENRGTLVKSPVELVVGTLRSLDLTPSVTLPYATAVSGMSQVLFAPPNVKGWPGGERWINTSTLLARKQFLERLARPAPMLANGDDAPAMNPAPPAAMAPVATTPLADAAETAAPRQQRIARNLDRALARLSFDPAAWLGAQPGNDLPAHFAFAQNVLLPLPAVTPDVAEARAQRDPVLFVRAALLDPVYQLK
jgi:uncharacterized protein (DUF1800 family)